MRDIELVLLSYSISKDEIGQEIKQVNRKPVPIISQDYIRQTEFYNANQQGLKPSFKFIISSLNYNKETDLEYMEEKYTIIRSNCVNIDEVELICERRIGDA